MDEPFHSIQFSKDESGDFLDDFECILGSSLYIQCGWGGMFAVAASSQVPFLGPPIDRVCSAWEKQKEHIRTEKKLKPWCTGQQQTFDGRVNFKNKLSRILKTI